MMKIYKVFIFSAILCNYVNAHDHNHYKREIYEEALHQLGGESLVNKLNRLAENSNAQKAMDHDKSTAIHNGVKNQLSYWQQHPKKITAGLVVLAGLLGAWIHASNS